MMLERNGLGLGDFDFYEIHEAFAAQVLCTLEAWEDPVFCRERLGLERPLGSIDRAKLNDTRRLAGRRASRSARPAGGSSPASPSCCTKLARAAV